MKDWIQMNLNYQWSTDREIEEPMINESLDNQRLNSINQWFINLRLISDSFSFTKPKEFALERSFSERSMIARQIEFKWNQRWVHNNTSERRSKEKRKIKEKRKMNDWTKEEWKIDQRLNWRKMKSIERWMIVRSKWIAQQNIDSRSDNL